MKLRGKGSEGKGGKVGCAGERRSAALRLENEEKTGLPGSPES